MGANPNKAVVLDRWHQGRSPLTAEHFNQPVDVLRGMVRGVAPPRQIGPIPQHTRATPAVSALVIVVSVGLDSDNFVFVRRVLPVIIGNAWNGNFAVRGPSERMPVWPNQRAGDYEAFVVATPDSLDSETPILNAVFIAGGWWLPQYLRFRLPTPNQSVPFGDCTPHIVEVA